MKKQQNTKNRIFSWIIGMPIKFACITFVSYIALILLSAAVGWYSISAWFLSAILSVIIAGFVSLRKISHDNLDRYSFIALNNIQMFLYSILLIFITPHSDTIYGFMFKTLSMTLPQIIVIVLAGLFYFYLIGLWLSNIYAKYLRIRAMNVPAWKAIFSVPFGFAMLWMPGYLMQSEKDSAPVLTIPCATYDKFTRWILKSSFAAVGIISVLVLLSGLVSGTWVAIITLSMGVVFAATLRVRGEQKFRANIGRGYATSAVIVNVIMIIVLILSSAHISMRDSVKHQHTPNNDNVQVINITDK